MLLCVSDFSDYASRIHFSLTRHIVVAFDISIFVWAIQWKEPFFAVTSFHFWNDVRFVLFENLKRNVNLNNHERFRTCFSISKQNLWLFVFFFSSENIIEKPCFDLIWQTHEKLSIWNSDFFISYFSNKFLVSVDGHVDRLISYDLRSENRVDAVLVQK